ncbi:imidazoleglycerol-phosphate dehydratase HisB [Candidatus Poribacteria bacterium]|nr:imidazoleglycerol-phosphate dehydratase HisB [Candidatus Poribacteria bacterium]
MTAKKPAPTDPPGRRARLERRTEETEVTVSLDLNGDGLFHGATGVGFFDHMLTLLARHGGLSLTVRAAGDLAVDCHHTVEDVGILLGKALAEAAGDKAGITRYGHASVPMEEALCECAVDFCGRPYLFFSAAFERPMIENYATEVTEDFFRAVANNAGLTMHLECRRGRNAHHIAEGLFKSFARALRTALSADTRMTGVPSTKGSLE